LRFWGPRCPSLALFIHTPESGCTIFTLPHLWGAHRFIPACNPWAYCSITAFFSSCFFAPRPGFEVFHHSPPLSPGLKTSILPRFLDEVCTRPTFSDGFPLLPWGPPQTGGFSPLCARQRLDPPLRPFFSWLQSLPPFFPPLPPPPCAKLPTLF